MKRATQKRYELKWLLFYVMKLFIRVRVFPRVSEKFGACLNGFCIFFLFVGAMRVMFF